MENNHMHSVIAFLVSFVFAGFFTFICVEIKRKVNRKKCKYGNVKVGDVITPKEIKHD